MDTLSVTLSVSIFVAENTRISVTGVGKDPNSKK